MFRFALLGLYLITVPAVTLHAQQAPLPERGDRVRISSDDTSGEYRVAERQEESLVLLADPPSVIFDIPHATVERIEVYRGSTSRFKGFVLGGLAGGVLGTAVAVPCTAGGGHFTCRGVPAEERILYGAGFGALVGLVAWGGREIWEEVRLPGQPGPRTPGRGERLALAPGPFRITRDQIATSTQWNAAEIIQQLRPSWLRPRVLATMSTARVTADVLAANGQGGVPDPAVYPEVFQDDLHFGAIGSLTQFSAEQIEAIEFINSVDATTLYGTGYMGGIIRVITRL